MKHTPVVTDRGEVATPRKFPSPDEIASFRESVLAHYRAHGRHSLPWRHTMDPYAVYVSEVMLQQTQVGRVLEKWGPFIERFADFSALHRAPLARVLALWKGLGYNRRALYLKEAARTIVLIHGGILPDSEEDLVKLPGIGKNSAGAVRAFAFNRPVVFIETNIRTVFIHRFFPHRDRVMDAEIIPLVEVTLDTDNPRVWYWALMDYGAMIKEETGNLNRRSAHYSRQSPFVGSDRQIRGAILGLFVDPGGCGPDGTLTESTVIERLGLSPRRVRENLEKMIREGFIVRKGERLMIE